MRPRWHVGIPWWIALWYGMIMFVLWFMAALIVVAVLFLLGVISAGSWLAGAAMSKRWPERSQQFKGTSRTLWAAVDRFAGWADSVGIGHRPR